MPFVVSLIQGILVIADVIFFSAGYIFYREQRAILENLKNAVQLDVDPNLERTIQKYPNKRIEYAGIRAKMFSLAKSNQGSNQDIQQVLRQIRKYGRYILVDPSLLQADIAVIGHPFNLHRPANVSQKLPFTIHIDDISLVDTFELRNNAFGGIRPSFYGKVKHSAFPQDETIVTVYGKVSQVGPGNIRIEHTGDSSAPLIITKESPEELVNTQTEIVSLYRQMMYLFAFVSAIVLGKFLYTEWKKYSMHKRRLQICKDILPANNTSSMDSNLNMVDKTRTLCVVCKTKQRSALFTECNHLCTCEECAKKANRICPVCAKFSENVIPAFIS